jgi:hypothetical protein
MLVLHCTRTSISGNGTVASGLEPEGNAQGEFRAHGRRQQISVTEDAAGASRAGLARSACPQSQNPSVNRHGPVPKKSFACEMCKCEARDEPRRRTAMKKHNHSSDDRPIQYRGKYSRHSRGQALTNFASDRHTGATCLKPSRRTIEALAPAPAPSPLVSLFLS